MSSTPVGAIVRTPLITMAPISGPKPPIKAKTVGTRMSVATADILPLMSR